MLRRLGYMVRKIPSDILVLPFFFPFTILSQVFRIVFFSPLSCHYFSFVKNGGLCVYLWRCGDGPDHADEGAVPRPWANRDNLYVVFFFFFLKCEKNVGFPVVESIGTNGLS